MGSNIILEECILNRIVWNLRKRNCVNMWVDVGEVV